MTLTKHFIYVSCMNIFVQGFRKVATSRWEFFNDRFKKGERELLYEIRRRKAWTNKQQPNAPNQGTPQDSDEDQRSSSTSSSSGYTTLVDENKRLKKENGVLNTELTSMKRKCKELLDLVTKYSLSHAKEKEEDERPKLFGVRLDVQGGREIKRNRAEISESASIMLSQSCKQIHICATDIYRSLKVLSIYIQLLKSNNQIFGNHIFD